MYSRIQTLGKNRPGNEEIRLTAAGYAMQLSMHHLNNAYLHQFPSGVTP